MTSVISQLFMGELHPNERSCPENGRESILRESFTQNEQWLYGQLEGKASAHFRELIQICEELDAMVSYDSFRQGFVLGACLVMEACCGAGETE